MVQLSKQLHSMKSYNIYIINIFYTSFLYCNTRTYLLNIKEPKFLFPASPESIVFYRYFRTVHNSFEIFSVPDFSGAFSHAQLTRLAHFAPCSSKSAIPALHATPCPCQLVDRLSAITTPRNRARRFRACYACTRTLWVTPAARALPPADPALRFILEIAQPNLPAASTLRSTSARRAVTRVTFEEDDRLERQKSLSISHLRVLCNSNT